MPKLSYRTCDKLDCKKVRGSHYLCDDMSVTRLSEKTFSEYDEEDNKGIKHHPCYGYTQLYYYKDPFFYVTTPPMKCLFGIQKGQNSTFTMSLQFTDLETTPEMKHFYEFIQNTEFECMRTLGLTGKEEQRFISQIKHDAKGKYEPNLSVKLPFRYNRFETDIYSDTLPYVNILSVPSFRRMQCDIYLDKIWRTNEKFCAKWKAKCIHLL